jgi:hypothetical protein
MRLAAKTLIGDEVPIGLLGAVIQLGKSMRRTRQRQEAVLWRAGLAQERALPNRTEPGRPLACSAQARLDTGSRLGAKRRTRARAENAGRQPSSERRKEISLGQG